MVLELIIVFAISIFMILLFSLIITVWDKYTIEGALGILDEKAKSKHYCLKKTKICFLFIFISNRKWKSGYISKYSFWAMVAVYIYLVIAIIIEIILMSLNIVLRIEHPLIFVSIWVSIPLIFIFIIPLIFHKIQNEN